MISRKSMNHIATLNRQNTRHLRISAQHQQPTLSGQFHIAVSQGGFYSGVGHIWIIGKKRARALTLFPSCIAADADDGAQNP